MSFPTRRSLLRVAAGAAVLNTLPGIVQSVAATPISGDRSLAFRHLHTGETLNVVYRRAGAIDPEAITALNRLLRDWRTGQEADMDLALFDLLADLRDALKVDAPFGIISGYRSPKTNAALASKSGGVAKRSYHMRGMAIDIRIPGIPAGKAYPVALAMKRGGVGAYKAKNFLHVDTGPVRTW